MSSARRTWRAFSTSTRPFRATAAAARTGCRSSQLYSDEERFRRGTPTATADSVMRFYVPTREPDLDRRGDPDCARERAHAAAADLHRDVGAAERVPQSPEGARPRRAVAGPPQPAASARSRRLARPTPASPRAPSIATRAGTSTSSAAISSAPTRPPACSTSKYHLLLTGDADPAPDRGRPVARAAALGRRLPRLSPHAFERSDAGAGGRVSAVQSDLSALGLSLRARDRVRLTELKSRYACGAATMPPRSSTGCAPFSAARSSEILGEGLHEFIDFLQRYRADQPTCRRRSSA